jgi:hypothetical protein
MRTVILRDYLLEVLNERARERGEDVEIVWEHPRPQLVARDGEVVRLNERSGERAG